MSKWDRVYGEQIISFYDGTLETCRTVTMQITDDCCLNCSYCYQINKGHKMMSIDTAKKIVDMLFEMYDKDDKNNFISKATKGIIFSFIGGEPLMNIPVMDKTLEYFIDECVKRDHEWLTNFRASISSNGILYFTEEFQNFLKKYNNFIELTISIDGTKEIHDACRVDAQGNGSFDRSLAALQHYTQNYNQFNEDTKVTIAPENLKNFNTIIDFFTNNNITTIFANPIHEAVWTTEQAKIYYNELIQLADKMLEHDNIYCSRFEERWFRPMMFNDNSNWCGGTGDMVAFNPDGIAYPCLRYMESSLGDSRPPIIIGDVNEGLYQNEKTKEIKQMLSSVTRRSQSTDECYYCPVAKGCGWCSAWNYQAHGSVNHRNTNICWMHRAEALANVYYWNMKYRKEKSLKRFPLYLQQNYALEIIDEQEYDKLLFLSSQEE